MPVRICVVDQLKQQQQQQTKQETKTNKQTNRQKKEKKKKKKSHISAENGNHVCIQIVPLFNLSLSICIA